jgi:hypothetical protein
MYLIWLLLFYLSLLKSFMFICMVQQVIKLIKLKLNLLKRSYSHLYVNDQVEESFIHWQCFCPWQSFLVVLCFIFKLNNDMIKCLSQPSASSVVYMSMFHSLICVTYQTVVYLDLYAIYLNWLTFPLRKAFCLFACFNCLIAELIQTVL